MRLTARRTQEHRHALIVISAMLFVAAGAVVAVLAAASVGASRNEIREATSATSDDVRTAKITRDADGPDCSQQVFDNRTGRVITASQPCTNYDSNGLPIPTGTIHRLDAISKSFGSR